MVDVNDSFEVEENGITLNILWIGGGTTVPTFDAPAGSRFFLDTGEEYKQEGPALNNWVLQKVLDDQHAGLNIIDAGTTLEVTAGKNMISHGLCIEGELCLDGYLILGA